MFETSMMLMCIAGIILAIVAVDWGAATFVADLQKLEQSPPALRNDRPAQRHLGIYVSLFGAGFLIAVVGAGWAWEPDSHLQNAVVWGIPTNGVFVLYLRLRTLLSAMKGC